MSTKNLLDKQINIFIKNNKGVFPKEIKMRIPMFNSLIDDCGQDFSNLDMWSLSYQDIPIEFINNQNLITNKLIILN